MKFAVVILLVAVPLGCLGAIYRDRSQENNEPGFCRSQLYPHLGKLAPGIHRLQDTCAKIVCYDNGKVDYVTCGILDISEECKVKYDTSKPFPDCCVPDIEC